MIREKESSKKMEKGNQVSRKKNIQLKSTFLQDFIRELQILYDHLHNWNAQFKTFKEASEEAMNNSTEK